MRGVVVRALESMGEEGKLKELFSVLELSEKERERVREAVGRRQTTLF